MKLICVLSDTAYFFLLLVIRAPKIYFLSQILVCYIMNEILMLYIRFPGLLSPYNCKSTPTLIYISPSQF